jgi:hypothetical protein
MPKKPKKKRLANLPWIGLIHSTNLEPGLEEAFNRGLRGQGYESDPSQPDGGRKQINVYQVAIKSAYKTG